MQCHKASQAKIHQSSILYQSSSNAD